MGRTSRIFAVMLVLALLAAIASTLGMAMAPVRNLKGVAASLWELSGAMMAAFACAVVFDRGRLRVLMVIGIVAALLGWCTLQPALWLDVTSRAARAWGSVGMPLFALAGYATIVGTISQVRVWQRWAVRVVQATLALVTLLAAASIATMIGTEALDRSSLWNARHTFDEVMLRVCGTLGVLTALGIMAMLVAVALPRLEGGGSGAPEAQRRTFWMTCPRCGAHEQKKTEGDTCAACGLKITVTPT